MITLDGMYITFNDDFVWESCNLSKITFNDDFVCESCNLSKITKQSHKTITQDQST